MKRTVYLSDALDQEVRLWLPYANVSAICQEALESYVQASREAGAFLQQAIPGMSTEVRAKLDVPPGHKLRAV